MTTTISEIDAVNIAATMQYKSPQWADAMNAVISRRGARDAFMVTLAKKHGMDQKAWTNVSWSIIMLGSIESFDALQNFQAIKAMIEYILGNSELAKAMVEGQLDHTFSALLYELATSNIRPDLWVANLASMSVEECLAVRV